MSNEPITGLTYQEEGSLQTGALQNAELNYYGAWLNCVVLSVGDAAPPGSPADGDRYIVGAVATGAWATHDDKLAVYRDGWQFYEPIEGVTVHNLDDSSDWINEGSGGWAVKNAAGDVSSVNGLTGAVTAVTRGKHLIPIMSSGMSPKQVAGCATLAYFNGASGQPDAAYLAFDATTEEHAQFAVPMPKSWNEGTVTFVPIWMHPATTTNFGVCWKLRALAVSNDDTLVANFGTAQSSVDTGGTTSDYYAGPESSAITIAGTPATDDMVLFDIYRDPADGGDTMAVDAYLIGVRLFFTTDADNDA